MNKITIKMTEYYLRRFSIQILWRFEKNFIVKCSVAQIMFLCAPKRAHPFYAILIQIHPPCLYSFTPLLLLTPFPHHFSTLLLSIPSHLISIPFFLTTSPLELRSNGNPAERSPAISMEFGVLDSPIKQANLCKSIYYLDKATL